MARLFVASKILSFIQSQYSLKPNRISYVAKWTFFSSLSLCFQNNIHFAPHLVHLPSWLASFRASSIPCAQLPSQPEFSSLEASEEICVANLNDVSNCILYLQCDLHDLLVEWIPNGFSWIHELPRCVHAFFKKKIVLDSSLSLTVHRSFFKHFFVPVLQSIAASIIISNFFLAFLMASISLSIFQIDETNASQSSSVVNLWLFIKKRRLSVFERYRALVSPWPILPFPSCEPLLTCRTTFQATHNQVWQLLESSYRAP